LKEAKKEQDEQEITILEDKIERSDVEKLKIMIIFEK